MKLKKTELQTGHSVMRVLRLLGQVYVTLNPNTSKEDLEVERARINVVRAELRGLLEAEAGDSPDAREELGRGAEKEMIDLDYERAIALANNAFKAGR